MLGIVTSDGQRFLLTAAHTFLKTGDEVRWPAPPAPVTGLGKLVRKPKLYYPKRTDPDTRARGHLDAALVAIEDVTLVDGSFHTVDSSGMSFEIAGAHAFAKGVKQANPVLLEPIMRVQITVPDSFAGDVIGDLNSKRGRIQGMTPQGDGTTLIEAEAPRAEMLRYATELRSQTQGLGAFSMEFDHYEEVPQHLLDKLVEQMKEKTEAQA